ncbi:MAG: HlyD family efflux transporter periplasmic adaptor subunit, partial [Planctomycetota bacterium]
MSGNLPASSGNVPASGLPVGSGPPIVPIVPSQKPARSSSRANAKNGNASAGGENGTVNDAADGDQAAREQFQQVLQRLAAGPIDDPLAPQRFHELTRRRTRALTTFEVAFPEEEEPHIDRRFSQQQLSQHHGFRTNVIQWASAARQSGVPQISHPEDYELAVVCIPVASMRSIPAVMVLVLPKNQRATMFAASEGQSAARFYGLWLERRSALDAENRMLSMSHIIDLVSAIQKANDRKGAARSLACAIGEYDEVQHAAVVCRRGHRMNVTAVAALADFDSDATVTRRIREAAMEALLHDRGAHWPTDDTDPQHAVLQHEKLAQDWNTDYVCTQCLFPPDDESGLNADPRTASRGTSQDETEPFAVLVWGGRNLTNSDPQYRMRMQAAAAPVAEAMYALQRPGRGLMGRTLNLIGRIASSGKGWIVLLMLAAACGVMFVPWPYRLRCTVDAAPVTRRYAVAPYDGIVRQGFVKPGDRVTKDQVLARMDDRELRLELAGVLADEHRYKTERDTYLAIGNISESERSRLQAARSRSRRDLLTGREQQLEIVSPIDGFVLSGDLERSQNAPVATGESLYEIGPVTPIKIRIHIPADDIRYVKTGHGAKIWIDGLGSEPIESEIIRVSPRSQTVDGTNVFVAEI